MKLQNTPPKQIHSSTLNSLALFSIIFLLCQRSLANAHLSNQTDQLALLEFKHQIANNPVFNSWNTSLHFCQWKGVECGHRHHRVIGLNLTDQNMFGTISPHIGNLSFLRFIKLQHNDFHGKIPQQIGYLYRLRVLDLTNNTLGGSLPANLSRCFNFRSVYLGGSLQILQLFTIEKNLLGTNATDNLSFITSLSNCSNLQRLGLDDNNFRGEILSSIGNLSVQLNFLALGGNHISGIIPTAIENLTNLSALGLENNLLSGPIPNSLGFSPQNLIGSGSFGSVYKGKLNPREEKLVAVKVLNLQKSGASKSFVTECRALRNIRHRNLVKILTYCSSIDFKGNEFKALVYEFMANGSLDMWLHPQFPERSTALSLIQRLNIAIDVASAIHYLHDFCEPPIIHCDLKPSNILLDNDLTAHIGDFGLARLLSNYADTFAQAQSSSMGIEGSIGYAAPEYGMSGAASKCGDVYSYGVLLLEMFTRRRPTDDMFKDDLNLHNYIKKALQEQGMQIVDQTLLTIGEPEETEAAIVEEEREAVNEIKVEQYTTNTGSLFHGSEKLQKCIIAVLKIGLACSTESPKQRMGMNDILRELHHIKTAFLNDGININRSGGPRYRRSPGTTLEASFSSIPLATMPHQFAMARLSSLATTDSQGSHIFLSLHKYIS
ncbi:hypothetical protein LguiA_007725 [Lonicera macranthoides]